MFAETVEWIDWTPHPEVWGLVVAVLLVGRYAARTVQPKAVALGGEPITRAQKRWFWLGVFLLWVASDWPLHDIAEDYLYWMHMVQHLLITFVIPPVFMLAMPAWLFRLIVGEGKGRDILRRVARPLPAAVIYNLLLIFSHWPDVVRWSVNFGPFHYLVHLMLFTSAVLVWIPVVAPAHEFRASRPAAMISLFMLSVLPTIPAGWLSAAEGVVYKVYDRPVRLWGESAMSDQQTASAIMKVVSGMFLWLVITVIFLRWMKPGEIKEGTFRGRRVGADGTVAEATDDGAAPSVGSTEPDADTAVAEATVESSSS